MFPAFVCGALDFDGDFFSRIQHTQLQEGGAGGHGPLGLRALVSGQSATMGQPSDFILSTKENQEYDGQDGHFIYHIYHHIPSWAFNHI